MSVEALIDRHDSNTVEVPEHHPPILEVAHGAVQQDHIRSVALQVAGRDLKAIVGDHAQVGHARQRIGLLT